MSFSLTGIVLTTVTLKSESFLLSGNAFMIIAKKITTEKEENIYTYTQNENLFTKYFCHRSRRLISIFSTSEKHHHQQYNIVEANSNKLSKINIITTKHI